MLVTNLEFFYSLKYVSNIRVTDTKPLYLWGKLAGFSTTPTSTISVVERSKIKFQQQCHPCRNYFYESILINQNMNKFESQTSMCSLYHAMMATIITRLYYILSVNETIAYADQIFSHLEVFTNELKRENEGSLIQTLLNNKLILHSEKLNLVYNETCRRKCRNISIITTNDPKLIKLKDNSHRRITRVANIIYECDEMDIIDDIISAGYDNDYLSSIFYKVTESRIIIILSTSYSLVLLGMVYK
jgi:hypothetical protein